MTQGTRDTDIPCGPGLKAAANAFNDFFANIGESTGRELSAASKPLTESAAVGTEQRFNLSTVSIREVKKAVRSMANKTGGNDDISVRALKASLDATASSLTFIINSSLTKGVVPSRWKQAVVISVHKSGDRGDPKNFRPISLLPVVSKVAERLVHQQLTTYLESNNLLSPCQYGFRRGRSTEMALLTMTEQILHGMENHKFSLLCLLDLSKAFDSVPHRKLLDKLLGLGISNPWFESYLSGRTQAVRMGNILSNSAAVNCGVPQGSILGPLFFIIHINDIPSRIKERVPRTEVAVYADDIQMLNQTSRRNIQQMFDDGSNNIETAQQCFGGLGLRMNASKTQSMLCGSSQALVRIGVVPNLMIHGETLDTEAVVKDLGVHIDAHMTFSVHVDHLVQQMCGVLCYLSRIRHYLTEDATKLLVTTLVLSRLNYCSVVWAGIGKTDVHKLQKMVNFAARVIYCKRKSEHVTPLLKNLNWLTVENKLRFDTLVLMYRVAHCTAPGGVTALFRYVHETSMRTTRQSRDFYEPMGRTEAGRRTVAYRGSRLWNNLPQSLRDAPSLSSFKRQLRSRLLNQQWS